MKIKLHPNMMEALRLTRAGNLTEAVTLIKRTLQGGSEPDPAPNAPPPPPPANGGSRRLNGPSESPSPLPKFAEALLKPKPDAPTAEGRFLTFSYQGQDGARAYKLYEPSGSRGRPLPLIVMLHGCTQTADDFAAGTRMNEAAEENGFFVAYPVQSKAANQLKCWNWFNPADQRRGRGEPAILAGITREIMRGHPIDPRRVYVAGLSAGGAAAAIMGAAYPDLYAAVGVHSGLACGAANDLSSALAAMKSGSAAASRTDASNGAATGSIVPTIVFHGDKDATVHPRNGEQVIEQLRASSRMDLRKTVQRAHRGGRDCTLTRHLDASGRAALEMWVIHGGGHAWSGGGLAGSYADPQGPDASREMVRFFLEQTRETAAH